MVADQQMERVTVTLTRSQVLALKGLAKQNKVAVAWLVRHAVERLLDSGESVQLPLDLGKPS
jgi:hypothetical protein